MHRDGVNGVDGLYNARTVELTPDGKYAYVAASSDDAISMFERNASSGELTYLGIVKDGVDGVDGLDAVIGLDMSADGQFLYSAKCSG